MPLLLFDIDGTLLGSRGRGLRSMHAAFQEVFTRPARTVTIVPHGKTDPVLFEEMAAAYELPLATLWERWDELTDATTQCLAVALREPDSVELKPGVRALLGALQARDDVVLGLVSGNLEHAAWLKLAAGGVDGFFRGGAFGSDARERSALVALALHCLRPDGRTRPVPERVWVIGDTPADVAGAHAHCVRALAVATGMHDEQTLRDCAADVVLPDLSDVAHTVDILCASV